MICTFIITFCSCRIKQLRQCLRFLHLREPQLSESQVLLVCQDHCDYTGSPFDDTVVINLDMRTYRRPLMLNVGGRDDKYLEAVLGDFDRFCNVNQVFFI